MADPLSITASLLAITAAAVKSVKSLHETVKRYRGRDKLLRRLQDELEDLNQILDSLTKVTNAEEAFVALLQGPIARCSLVCREFEVSMEVFSGKLKTGLRDWTRMEFMRGDINEFIDTIAGYKSTISVGLGTITMHNSRVSQHVLLEYNEVIQDTAYNLELHLRRIDEKMTRLTLEHGNPPGISVNLKDEREVTKQCLRVCEDARSYLQTLSDQASSLLHETPERAVGEQPYEAQLRMGQTLGEARDSFTQTLGHLSRRLESLVRNPASENDNERQRLQSDVEISKQCLEVCSMASEVSRQKVYKIGEVVADGDSDQVVVTTLADLFDIGKALSKDNSAQLVGSMTGESLRHLTEQRYSSRFGALAHGSKSTEVGIANSLSTLEVQKSGLAQAGDHEQRSGLRTKQYRPSSNEMRKRTPGGATD